MKNYLERYNDLWCKFMHNGELWPIHGVYKCRECLRERPVPWAHDSAQPIAFLRHAA